MKPRQYGINLEWELCNATMLEARAPEMYGMLHEYITVKKVFPGKSPDGTYNPSTWTEDITAVRDAGVAGAISGKALYEGRFSLAEALICSQDG